MIRNLRLYIALVAIVPAAIYAGSFVPQLTTAGGINNGVEDQAAYEAAFTKEYSYCMDNMDDLDCRCFADIAGVVIASAPERIPGAKYPSQSDLARWQASESC